MFWDFPLLIVEMLCLLSALTWNEISNQFNFSKIPAHLFCRCYISRKYNHTILFQGTPAFRKPRILLPLPILYLFFSHEILSLTSSSVLSLFFCTTHGCFELLGSVYFNIETGLLHYSTVNAGKSLPVLSHSCLNWHQIQTSVQCFPYLRTKLKNSNQLEKNQVLGINFS